MQKIQHHLGHLAQAQFVTKTKKMKHFFSITFLFIAKISFCQDELFVKAEDLNGNLLIHKNTPIDVFFRIDTVQNYERGISLHFRLKNKDTNLVKIKNPFNSMRFGLNNPKGIDVLPEEHFQNSRNNIKYQNPNKNPDNKTYEVKSIKYNGEPYSLSNIDSNFISIPSLGNFEFEICMQNMLIDIKNRYYIGNIAKIEPNNYSIFFMLNIQQITKNSLDTFDIYSLRYHHKIKYILCH